MKNLSLSYENYTCTLLVNGAPHLTSDSERGLKKEINKLKKQGYDFNQSTLTSGDEFDGLCQANQIGENPYKCTIMAGKHSLSK